MDGNYLLVDSDGNATAVDGEITIGRGTESSLILKDKLVSRHHVTVWMEGDVLMIRDEESVNGTFVNDEQIYEPTELKAGDTFRLGDEVLTVRPPLGDDATVRDVRAPEEVEKEVEAEAPKEEQSVDDFSDYADYEEVQPEKPVQPVEAAQTPDSVVEVDEYADQVEAGGEKNNNKTLLIIGLVALVLVCCCVVVGVGGWLVLANSY